MADNWYVLRSKPGKEHCLTCNLQMDGVICYFPCLKTNPVNPRARKYKPYFPGYLFVQADLEQEGHNAFRWIPYSLGLVCYGDEPAIVPDNLVFGIQRTLEKIDAAGGEELYGLNPGDKVLIEEGPFAGYRGVFDTHLSSSDRVCVLLTMLQDNREIPVELNVSYVMKD